MTLQNPAGPAPVNPPVADEPATGRAVDPFGLWESPVTASGESVFFGMTADGGPVDGSDLPAAVWTLSLTGGSAGQSELEQRAAKVQAINNGLDQARARADAYLAARGKPADAVSFGVGDLAGQLPTPEVDLAYALSKLEPGGTAAEVSFGLGQDIQRLAGQVKQGFASVRPTGVDWNELRQDLDGLLDSVNRQLLHFVWVDTTLAGCLAARTTVNWGGDLVTFWGQGLSSEQTGAHARSLQLAMASRAANLRTVLTVSQIAGKITLAVTTPLGTMQALSLGWMFVREVVMPLVKQAK